MPTVRNFRPLKSSTLVIGLLNQPSGWVRAGGVESNAVERRLDAGIRWDRGDRGGRSGRLDDDLEGDLLDGCEVQLVGVRPSARSDPVPAGSEPHGTAGAVPGDLHDVDVLERRDRDRRRIGRHDRSDAQVGSIQFGRRLDARARRRGPAEGRLGP